MGSYSRVKAHLLQISGKGIRACCTVTKSHRFEMQRMHDQVVYIMWKSKSMLSNILNIYCKNIFNNFLITESCRTHTHLFQKLPSPAPTPAPAPAPAPKSRNAPVLHSPWHNPQTHAGTTHNPQDPREFWRFCLRCQQGRFRDGDGWEGESGDEIERSVDGEWRGEKWEVRSESGEWSTTRTEIEKKKFFFFLRKRKKEINKIM